MGKLFCGDEAFDFFNKNFLVELIFECNEVIYE